MSDVSVVAGTAADPSPTIWAQYAIVNYSLALRSTFLALEIRPNKYAAFDHVRAAPPRLGVRMFKSRVSRQSVAPKMQEVVC
jgi:hypothetical protein